MPDGELHAAGAGQSVRDPDPGLEWRCHDPRDGLRPARHRGRRETGERVRPLIGQEWSRDFNTGFSLVNVSSCLLGTVIFGVKLSAS